MGSILRQIFRGLFWHSIAEWVFVLVLALLWISPKLVMFFFPNLLQSLFMVIIFEFAAVYCNTLIFSKLEENDRWNDFEAFLITLGYFGFITFWAIKESWLVELFFIFWIQISRISRGFLGKGTNAMEYIKENSTIAALSWGWLIMAILLGAFIPMPRLGISQILTKNSAELYGTNNPQHYIAILIIYFVGVRPIITAAQKSIHGQSFLANRKYQSRKRGTVPPSKEKLKKNMLN